MTQLRPLRTVWDLPREELFTGGHMLCQGCAVGTIVRTLLKVTGPETLVACATGCLEVATTQFPYTSWRVPWIHIAFENAAAVASGLEAAVKALKKKGVLDPSREVKVVTIAGDGGTFDIGLQALSGMLERGHRVLYVVYDNEAYMNTGVQRSGATPRGAWTTTTPVGRRLRGEWREKKDVLSIVTAHRVPYVATASPAYLLDMARKFSKALATDGPSLVHVISPCPPGWGFDPRLTIRVARLAVETALWVNLEYVKGELQVTTPVPRRKHVREYLRLQARFSHLTEEEVEEIQRTVDRRVEEINARVGREVIGPLSS